MPTCEFAIDYTNSFRKHEVPDKAAVQNPKRSCRRYSIPVSDGAKLSAKALYPLPDESYNPEIGGEPGARANAHGRHASCGAGGAPAVGVAHLYRWAHNMKITTYLLFLLVPALVATAETFRQFPEHQFSLVLPSGFTELKGNRVPVGLEAVYIDGDPDDGQAHIVISIQMMNGSIGQDSHLTKEQIPQNLREKGFSVGRLKWRDHSIDSINGQLTQSGIDLITIAAQVPLAPRALQLNFAGPLAQKEKIESLAQKTVASVIGLSNWEGPVMRKLSTTERIVSLIKGLAGLFITCAVVILLYRVIRKKKGPNQAPEPTPTAVTPPAGQEARQP